MKAPWNLTLFLTSCLFLCGIRSVQSKPSNETSWILENDLHQPCTIEHRIFYSQVLQMFGHRGIPPLFPDPIVILGEGHAKKEVVSTENDRNAFFRRLTRRYDIVEFFGPDFQVTLSSSNSLSERRRTIPLKQYLDEMQQSPETTANQLSNETWYLFGETYSDDWQELLKHYELPPCYTCDMPVEYPTALAFGIGNRGSGVQWHTHGPGFSEAIHGRKHWILYPPASRPPFFHKDQSSLQWMERVYGTLEEDEKPLECTLQPGDMIYFPDRWWHATINLDPYSVFVSAFTTEHGVDMERDEL